MNRSEFGKIFEATRNFIAPEKTPANLARQLRTLQETIQTNIAMAPEDLLNSDSKTLNISQKDISAKLAARQHSEAIETELNLSLAIHTFLTRIRTYTSSDKNPQVVRIREISIEFQTKFSNSKIKDIPQLVEELCIKIEQLN